MQCCETLGTGLGINYVLNKWELLCLLQKNTPYWEEHSPPGLGPFSEGQNRFIWRTLAICVLGRGLAGSLTDLALIGPPVEWKWLQRGNKKVELHVTHASLRSQILVILLQVWIRAAAFSRVTCQCPPVFCFERFAPFLKETLCPGA